MNGSPLSKLLLEDVAPDRLVASSGDHIISLRRFRADVGAAAARLAAVGCRRGLVVCDDAYWAAVGMFALAHNGAETVLPPNTLPATLTGLEGTFDHVVTERTATDAHRTLTLVPGEEGSFAIPAMDARAACVTLFTSGSTGTPKRVSKTIHQLELEAETVERVLGKAVPERAWVHTSVTHRHLYGLTFRLCWPLATGRGFFGSTFQFWEPVLATLEAGAVLVTSPSHLSRLGGIPPLPPERHPSAVLSGGAPLPDSAVEASLSVLGCAPSEFFGSTEAGVIATRLREGGPPPPWRPMPGIAVARLEDGRMHLRSPYSGEPDGQISDDLIDLDADGAFLLRGRADRIAKIEGVRVSLTEFDARLAELDGVVRAAVVVLGTTTPYLGAVVVLNTAGATELAAVGAFRVGRRLRRGLAKTLPSAALPRRWRFVAQLPAGGPIGKTRAVDLAALFDAA